MFVSKNFDSEYTLLILNHRFPPIILHFYPIFSLNFPSIFVKRIMWFYRNRNRYEPIYNVKLFVVGGLCDGFFPATD